MVFDEQTTGWVYDENGIEIVTYVLKRWNNSYLQE